jgi:hypothetical protein
MTGFVTTPGTAAAILAGIEQAMDARGLPRYWTTGAYPIHTGPHAGYVFIPADDTILNTPLMGSPVRTPKDFPEFDALVEALGGLDARVEIDPETLSNLEP